MLNRQICYSCRTDFDVSYDSEVVFLRQNVHYFYKECTECGSLHEIELLTIENGDDSEVCDCGAEKHGFIGHVTGCPAAGRNYG